VVVRPVAVAKVAVNGAGGQKEGPIVVIPFFSWAARGAFLVAEFVARWWRPKPFTPPPVLIVIRIRSDLIVILIRR
jgi:hypothetical protein